MSKVPYSNAIGSLMNAIMCTRPDISHVVRVVSKYMHDLGKRHWHAVKQILRYILNTVDVGLMPERDDNLGQCVVGYVNFDYASDLDRHQSTTGCVHSCKSTNELKVYFAIYSGSINIRSRVYGSYRGSK